MNTKTLVLQALEANKNTSISGSALAAKLGVSRNSIWKAINSLRNEGYQINAGTNKGYQLAMSNDILSTEGIISELASSLKTLPLHVYDIVESTNKTATTLAMDGALHGTTVIARGQTEGRGRRGRSFYSPKDTGVYLSVILNPTFDISKAVLITAAAAVAVVRAIKNVTGKDAQIKWVNDIYLDNKKVCGILTEAITDFETGQISHIIVGIGVNCRTTNFPDIANNIAGSLGGEFSRNNLVAQIINNLMELSKHLEDRQFILEYRKYSLIIGKEINIYRTIGCKPEPAIAKDIDNNGALIVKLPNGTEEIISTGEITIRLKGLE